MNNISIKDFLIINSPDDQVINKANKEISAIFDRDSNNFNTAKTPEQLRRVLADLEYDIDDLLFQLLVKRGIEPVSAITLTQKTSFFFANKFKETYIIPLEESLEAINKIQKQIDIISGDFNGPCNQSVEASGEENCHGCGEKGGEIGKERDEPILPEKSSQLSSQESGQNSSQKGKRPISRKNIRATTYSGLSRTRK